LGFGKYIRTVLLVIRGSGFHQTRGIQKRGIRAGPVRVRSGSVSHGCFVQTGVKTGAVVGFLWISHRGARAYQTAIAGRARLRFFGVGAVGISPQKVLRRPRVRDYPECVFHACIERNARLRDCRGEKRDFCVARRDVIRSPEFGNAV
jgi:hypothetical protein